MKIEPVLTEKSLAMAKTGHYTFWVPRGLEKPKVKKLVGEIYGVTVVTVRTINIAGETRRTTSGRRRTILPTKKAIVTLAEKQSIKAFEAKK